MKEGSTAILGNIFSMFDKISPEKKSLTQLQKLATFLHENPQTRVEISGHTDNSGSDAHNKQLSLKELNLHINI